MQYSCITDKGLIREKNQDSYLAIKNNHGDYLLLVADGIGGGKAGEVASGETVRYFGEVFPESGPFDSLVEATDYINYHLNKANRHVYDMSLRYDEYSGMGTTLTGILVTKYGVLSINCGDSRVYGYLDGKSFRLTDDHTLVNEMVKTGRISYEEAINHPKRHYLVKAIGIFSKVICDVHQVKKMDYYLICSDGLHSYVPQEEIDEVVVSDDTLDSKVEKLVKLSLSKGGYDNVTIILGSDDHE